MSRKQGKLDHVRTRSVFHLPSIKEACPSGRLRTVPHVLQIRVQCSSVRRFSSVRSRAEQSSAVQCSAVQCSAVQCSAVGCARCRGNGPTPCKRGLALHGVCQCRGPNPKHHRLDSSDIGCCPRNQVSPMALRLGWSSPTAKEAEAHNSRGLNEADVPIPATTGLACWQLDSSIWARSPIRSSLEPILEPRKCGVANPELLNP